MPCLKAPNSGDKNCRVGTGYALISGLWGELRGDEILISIVIAVYYEIVTGFGTVVALSLPVES